MIEIVDGSPPYLLGLGAIVCFGLAVVLAWRDRIKAGALVSTLFVLCVVLAYFPQLDSIRAFAVDVRLRHSLDRADEILARLKDLTIASAKTSYMTLAWGNRLGTPSVKDKQAILDQFDEQLLFLKVSSDERREIERPYVQLIGADLYGIFCRVMERYAQWKEEVDLRRGENTPARIAERQNFTAEIGEWRKALTGGPYANLKNYDLEMSLKHATPDKLLDDKSRPKVEQFRKELLALYIACEAKGGYTKEAADFVDPFMGQNDMMAVDAKMKEVFGVSFE